MICPTFRAALLLASALSFPAIAEPKSPPPQFFPPDHIAIPQQSNILAWAPAPGGSAGTAYNVIGTGRTNSVAIELEGDYLAVQVLYYNNTATAWTLAQSTVAPSATYGTQTGGNTTPGVTPYDVNGAAIPTMLPVTFNNGGQNSLPWSSALEKFTGTSATSGQQILPLALSANTVIGNGTLTFSSTTTNPAFAGISPAAGMYVTDGKGCLAPGTTASTVGGGTATISPVAAAQCNSGQNIWFSYQPIVSLSQVVPPTTNGLNGTIVYSDWIPMQNLPRIDGGMVAGMSVSCTGCGAGLTVASVKPQSVTLSGNVASDVALGAAVTFSMAPTLTAAAVVNRTWLQVSSGAGLQRGQAVTGSVSIPANTVVTYVSGNFVRISQMLTGSIALNAAITFSNVASTTADTPSGNVLPFLSTSTRPLLLIRSMAASGTPIGHSTATAFAAFETSLGMPNIQGTQSTTTTDGLNFTGNFGNSTAPGNVAAQTLPFAVRYVTRNRGVTICPIGDSVMAGGGSGTAITSFAKIIAAALTMPTRPVSSAWSAVGGAAPNIFTPEAAHWLANGTCNIALIQHPSRNSVNLPDIETYAAKMAQIASSMGARPVFVTGALRGGTSVYNWTVAAPGVTNGTVVPLSNTVVSNNLKNNGDSGLAITSPHMPAGTTFSFTKAGATSITLSQAATLPAGEVMTIGYYPSAVLTNNSAAVTLGVKAPTTDNTYIAVAADACIPAAATITTTQDSTSATLSANATCSDTTTITLTNNQLNTEAEMAQGSGDIQSAATPELPVIDVYFCPQDPNSPTNYLPTYSFDATHPNYDAWQTVLNGNPAAPAGQCPGALSMLRRLIP